MPTRGFPTREYETRTSRAQQAMRDVQLDALLVTTEPEIRYFTGFQTQFFESPTRPWFLIVPADGQADCSHPNDRGSRHGCYMDR